ncbi:low molecular weight protein-tyrosine-phosphatase [Merdibacter massiliensis]|uniref:low molecular weight protein-tyrosine-phosphatase n=1 Tax=Merdibacter massiliensis TaxID=1871030 RepID=UPI00192A6322|nr:low molecular weight protein-tyrosine-phosphatase [Merdibacter massiliensis]
MIKILFVCHGNICRSPMAQYVMQYLINEAGLSDKITVDSAATSREEIGNSIHYGTKKKLREMGIPFDDHRARQMTKQDYENYDLLIGMESVNIRNMLRIAGGDPKQKIRRILDFTEFPKEIDDPWYTGDFDITYEQIMQGCQALLTFLEK